MPIKSIPIELGGKTKRLCYGTNALAEMNYKGISLSNMQEKFVGPEDIVTLRAVFWAGLLHEDRDITIEEAGDLMDAAESFVYIIEKIGEAILAAFPVEKPESDSKNSQRQGNQKSLIPKTT